jgi:hypothetical protein
MASSAHFTERGGVWGANGHIYLLSVTSRGMWQKGSERFADDRGLHRRCFPPPSDEDAIPRCSGPSSPGKKSRVASERRTGQIASAPGANDRGVLEVRRRRERGRKPRDGPSASRGVARLFSRTASSGFSSLLPGNSRQPSCCRTGFLDELFHFALH